MSTPDLEELYREILLDHYRRPRNKGALGAAASCSADGANPLCGDQVTVAVHLDDGRIDGIAFDGAGCSISQASSSMMTEYVKGRGVPEAFAAVEAFQQMMVNGEPPDGTFADTDIEALLGVAKFPVRVKCASLAWKTLEQALQACEIGAPEAPAPVTTDERSEGHV